MDRFSERNIMDQLRRVIQDGVDYLQSALLLLQARAAEFALSGVVFVVMIGFAGLLVLAAFVLLNVAVGVWLAKALGHGGYAAAILAGAYLLLALALGGFALRWLNRLRS